MNKGNNLNQTYLHKLFRIFQWKIFVAILLIVYLPNFVYHNSIT